MSVSRVACPYIETTGCHKTQSAALLEWYVGVDRAAMGYHIVPRRLTNEV